MAVPDAGEETLVKFYTVRGARLIFARNARENENWPTVQNMDAALDVERK